MQTLTEIKALLAERGMHPRKRFGQNFLHDQNMIRKLLDAAFETPTGVILEIGPGTGALTEAILERAPLGGDVVVCEIDRDLAEIIDARLGERIILIQGDALASKRELNPEVTNAIAGRPFRLIANLPYNIASPLTANLLLAHANCEGMFITIQKEVADRLLARPGTKAYGPLGVMVQTFAEVNRIAAVPPSCFWPQPEVTSAMVSIVPRQDCPEVERAAYAAFITRLFTKRRKQLGSILGRSGGLPPGIDPARRPESLAPEQLVQLFTAQQAARRPPAG